MSDGEIVAAYLGGQDGTTVGLMAGISAATVIKIVRAAGHKPRPRGGRLGNRWKLKLDDQVIAQRYLAGESGPALAASLGVSQKTIYNVLAALDIPRRDFLTELRRRNQVMRQARQRKVSRIAAIAAQ